MHTPRPGFWSYVEVPWQLVEAPWQVGAGWWPKRTTGQTGPNLLRRHPQHCTPSRFPYLLPPPKLDSKEIQVRPIPAATQPRTMGLPACVDAVAWLTCCGGPALVHSTIFGPCTCMLLPCVCTPRHVRTPRPGTGRPRAIRRKAVVGRIRVGMGREHQLLLHSVLLRRHNAGWGSCMLMWVWVGGRSARGWHACTWVPMSLVGARVRWWRADGDRWSYSAARFGPCKERHTCRSHSGVGRARLVAALWRAAGWRMVAGGWEMTAIGAVKGVLARLWTLLIRGRAWWALVVLPIVTGGPPDIGIVASAPPPAITMHTASVQRL